MMMNKPAQSLWKQVLKINLISNGCVFSLLLLGGVNFGEKIFLSFDRTALSDRVQDIEKLLNESNATDYLRFKIREDWGNRDVQKVFGIVWDENKSVILETPGFPTVVRKNLWTVENAEIFDSVEAGSLFKSIFTVINVKGHSYYVGVSINRTREIEIRERFRKIGVYGVVLFLVLSVLITQVLLNVMLKPLKKIVHEIETLKIANRGFRLSTNGVPSEMHLFVKNINDLLRTLEISIEKNRMFGADIAHELRSPIHRSRLALEIGLKSAVSISELREVIVDALTQMEGMSRLVGDLLFLSRVERNLESSVMTEANIDTELVELVEYYKVVAEEKKQRILFVDSNPSGVFLMVRVELFRRAVSNLLENAIRYSPAGALTSIEIFSKSCEVWIEVRDEGFGFDESVLDLLPDRTYRIDGSRIFSQEGLGIGLSLVKAVMELHKGRIEVIRVSPAKGSILRLVFPLTSA